MDDVTAADGPRCTVCTSRLWTDERTRQSCFRCQQAVDENLRRLAGPRGLYALLSAAMLPGRSSNSGRVSGSRTAPIPLRLEPLSLAARGGIVTILQTWAEDWYEHMGRPLQPWRGTMQQQCDAVVQTLRFNLEQAAREHPAFGEFAHEVWQMVRQCERNISGERPERIVALICTATTPTGAPCSQVLRVTLSTTGRQCGCGAQYGFTELRRLPLAERHAA